MINIPSATRHLLDFSCGEEDEDLEELLAANTNEASEARDFILGVDVLMPYNCGYVYETRQVIDMYHDDGLPELDPMDPKAIY